MHSNNIQCIVFESISRVTRFRRRKGPGMVSRHVAYAVTEQITRAYVDVGGGPGPRRLDRGRAVPTGIGVRSRRTRVRVTLVGTLQVTVGRVQRRILRLFMFL